MEIFGKTISPRVQVIFVVVVLIVAVVLYYRSLAGEPVVSNKIKFVCVATGRTFTIDRDKVGSVPMKNPDTGESTLFPCVEREGKLYVDSYYRDLLRKLGEVNQYVDEKTLAVKPGR